MPIPPDDPDGWFMLTGTIGPPRWVKTPTGLVNAEKQFARLALQSGADPAAVRSDSLIFTSTETNLTVNASVALSSELRPLRIRIRDDREWFAVESIELFGPLAINLVQVRPLVGHFVHVHSACKVYGDSRHSPSLRERTLVRGLLHIGARFHPRVPK